MARRCVLHIGMNKTGSSSIQEAAASHRPDLKERFDITYLDGPSNHSVLRALFMDDPLTYHLVRSMIGPHRSKVDRWVKHQRELIDKTVRSIGGGILLMSGEGFSGMPEREVERLGKDLTDNFETVDVFIYVREPFGFAQSKAQQNVKSGYTFEEIVQSTLSGPISDRSENSDAWRQTVLPHYRFRIEKFQNVFGVDNVHIRPFSRHSLRNGDAVTDFFHWAFGFDWKDEGFDPVRVNEQIDPAYIYVLEVLNKQQPLRVDGYPNLKRARTLLHGASPGPDAPAFYVPGLNLKRFGELVAEDVAWLKEATEARIDFAGPPPVYQEVPAYPDMSVVAKILNRQSLAAEQQSIRAQIFRAMWQLKGESAGDAVAAETELMKIFERCFDPAFLLNTALNLKAASRPELAGSALTRIADLLPEQDEVRLRASAMMKALKKAY